MIIDKCNIIIQLYLVYSFIIALEKLRTWWSPEDDQFGVFLFVWRRGSTAVCPCRQPQCAPLHPTSNSLCSCPVLCIGQPYAQSPGNGSIC